MLPQQNGLGRGRKLMDKFMENRWFMRIVGLTLAFLLYMSVNFDDLTAENTGTNPQSDAETIEDVPLEAFYDQENLVVSGLPSTVDISVEGPMSIVQSAKALKDFQVFVDLNDIGLGSHQIPIKIQNISEKLKVTIEPSYVNVTVQEKVSQEFSVDVEFDDSVLAKGFEVETLTTKPNKVTITGSKEAIESITYVKATLDIEDTVDETFTEEARVQVLDRELNKLNVTIEPQVVDVTVKVVNPSKEVPVAIEEIGDLPEGVRISNITIDPERVRIFGKQNTLDAISEMGIQVDVSEITEDTTIEVPIKLNDGLNKVEPEMIEVTIEVEDTAERTITGVSFVPIGLSNDYEYSVLSPEDGVDITLEGFKEELDEITKEDFTLNLDLTGLEPGEHEVEISASGPEGLAWSLSQNNITVQIREKTSV